MGLKINAINIELNKSDAWIDKVCTLCGRKYPNTLLNIEGAIHHRCKLKCIDSKSCKRVARKTRRAG